MVDLWFDVIPRVSLKRGNVDFVVEMANVTHDGLILHFLHMFMSDHMIVTGAGYENVAIFSSVIHGHDTIAFHGSLQRANRINFSYPNLGRECAHCLCRAFSYIPVTGNNSNLSRNHHIGCTFNAIHQRLSATVQVVEFGFGN